MEDVSYTAQWTAAARCVETARGEHALFEDNYACALAAPRGFELLRRYRGGGVAEYVAIRTRYMDDAITRVVAGEGVEQVVMVAGGMDTRPYRLSWPAGVTVYDVDHAALLAEKRVRLNRLRANPAVRVVDVAADLSGDWVPALRERGFDSTRRCLWVAEGLLFFLTEGQATTLLRTLAELSTAGSRISADLTSATLLRHPMTQGFLRTLREDGTPWRFGTDSPIELLREHGWTVDELKQPGEPGAGYGRWPYGVYPLDVPGVPRNWLVQATRDPDSA